MNSLSEPTMNKITPFLWFDANAEAAADFYLSIFPGSRKLNELRTTEAGPGPKGSLLAIDLEIEGQQVTFLNGGPSQKLSDAFSFVIRCESQQEIDDYWSKLTDGGSETACGWLKDKFGVSWQVVPADIYRLVSHPAAMRAMMGMIKLDIAALEQAASQAE
jgi:predicted 3-demethylubiquinone-9 3-methyltransferase (glyoxalase superfamily)